MIITTEVVHTTVTKEEKKILLPNVFTNRTDCILGDDVSFCYAGPTDEQALDANGEYVLCRECIFNPDNYKALYKDQKK